MYYFILGIITLWVVAGGVAAFFRSLHIFQLSLYDPQPWAKRINEREQWLAHIKLHLAPWYIFKLKKQTKKRLVMTPRAIRLTVTAALFNLLTGAVVALIFAAFLFKGHQGFFVFVVVHSCFIGLIVASAATENFLPLINWLNSPIEKRIGDRYINEAKELIASNSKLITIGVTGSYGKTSVKYFLGTILSGKWNTLITPESYNTTMGVVKTVRGSLLPTHEIFVCEMGAKKQGEIKEICDIVSPKHAVITAIGPQHLETFGSIDNIIKTKFELTDSITDGIAFLNFGNDYIKTRSLDKTTVRYCIGGGTSDYCGNVTGVSERGMTFDVTFPDQTVFSFETRLLGTHSVENLTGAIAVAHSLGMTAGEIAFQIKKITPVPHRLQLHQRGDDLLIDDAFNSNPVGAASAVDTLRLFDGTRILITPGMVELGDKEYELNRNLGRHAAICCDIAVLIGKTNTASLHEGLIQGGFDENQIKMYNTVIEGIAFADSLDTAGKRKIILLENDLPDDYN
ncbi:MAG: UDP-N-acetylmuramoyl-tripeptide--D-alanyl-D-alanine ligase [Oscillospiraceae bacterium]|jgi:UDP-N-acetylmuramoyl-tripeptide--D-alanyl-D-alanine ligase|nr:UDP-N-acetylmuramoyl-tripeptide--D-alanyl-D-alanine ligase [Oscillospiraceae bacterium]